MTKVKEGDIVTINKPGFTYHNKEGQITRIDHSTKYGRGEFTGHKSRIGIARVRRFDTGQIEEIDTRNLIPKGVSKMESTK